MEYKPLSEACMSEVLARVSFRLLHRYSRAQWAKEMQPQDALGDIAFYLQQDGWDMLATWVLAYKREWSPMTPTKFIRDAFIYRARQGYTWRHVVFPQYKSGRSDPRVTNRGVARETYWVEKEQ